MERQFVASSYTLALGVLEGKREEERVVGKGTSRLSTIRRRGLGKYRHVPQGISQGRASGG